MAGAKKHWTQRIKEEMEKLRKERDEYKDLYLRKVAEFENYKKSIDARWKMAVEYASERIVSELLPVLDNFKRAIDTARKSKDFESFAKGVEMIYRQLVGVLEKEGLKEFQAVGKPFDPRFHEAISMVESELPEGTVVEEFETGYFYKDKLLRPAKVVVSKGQSIKSPEGGEKNE